MLRINGKKIGDVVEVTFVKSFFGVQAQERINDRLVLLEARYRAHPGDRCQVKIVQSRDPLICLVTIESVIQRGDGKQSTLQLVLDQIRKYSRGYGAVVLGWIWLYLHSIFPKDKQRILECWLDVLEHYKLEDTSEDPPIDYELLGGEIKRLIANLHMVSAHSRAEYYLRAADYCSGKKEGLQVAYDMATRALAYCRERSGLKTAALAEIWRLKAIIVEDLERQLADREKEGTQFMIRLQLARFKLQAAPLDDAREVIALIEPVYNELRRTEHFQEVARILSMAFLHLGHFDHADYWLRMSETRIPVNAPESALPPLIETYMRMSPELKRRVFNNASPSQ